MTRDEERKSEYRNPKLETNSNDQSRKSKTTTTENAKPSAAGFWNQRAKSKWPV